MAQGKAGWLIAGLCAAIVFTSVGYGMGRKAALKSIQDSVGPTPAGSPLPTIQIEPVQPQEELAAISSPAGQASSSVSTTAQTLSAVITPAEQESAAAIAGAGSPKDVQRALKAAGFDPGSTDGKMGPRTKSAIRDFQLANGLQADGKVGRRTWAKLQTYLKSGTAASTPAQTLGD